MKNRQIKTTFQNRKESREDAILREFRDLREAGFAVTAIEDSLMKKHKISRTSVYNARKNAERRETPVESQTL